MIYSSLLTLRLIDEGNKKSFHTIELGSILREFRIKDIITNNRVTVSPATITKQEILWFINLFSMNLEPVMFTIWPLNTTNF